jgi:hypothetical protein
MKVKYSEKPESLKIKERARSYANMYLKRGKIKKTPCIICGDKDTQAHHEDYSKPADVVWLCRKHHFEYHKLKKAVPLPNGCHFTELKVSPKNWQDKKASIEGSWIIYYTFFAPGDKKGKRCQIRGMNRIKSLKERQQATKILLTTELIRLKSGYNPIVKIYDTKNKQRKDDKIKKVGSTF